MEIAAIYMCTRACISSVAGRDRNTLDAQHSTVKKVAVTIQVIFESANQTKCRDHRMEGKEDADIPPS